MQPCLRACLMAALVASTAVASPVPKSQSSEDNAPPIRNEADLQPRADSNDLGPLNINAPLPGAPLLEDNAPPTTDKSASCTHTDVDGCLDIDFDKLPKGVAAILGAEGLPPMPWDLHVKNKSNRPLTTEPKTEGAPINAASLPPIPVDIGPDNKDTWTVSKESKTEVAGPMNQAAFPIIPVIGPDNKDTWTVNKEPKTELVAPMNEVALPPIPIDIGPDNKNTWNLIKEPMTTGYGWNEEHRPIGPLDNFTTTTMLNGGYWPAWQGAPDFSDDKCLPMESLTHINFAFAGIGQDGSLQLKNVPTLLAWTQQKENNPNLKVILSVGGGSGPKKFQTMTSTSALMRKFAETTAATVHKYGLDGIDIDWEFPEANEGQRFLALMTALREVLPSPLQISAALPTGDWVMSHLPMAELAEQIDFLNLMAYDLVDASYQGVSLTGHQANLFAVPGSANSNSGASSVQYILDQGFPANKIVLGIPLYGRSFANTDALNAPFQGAGANNEMEVKSLPLAGAEEHYDSNAVAAFSVNDETKELITYDNQQSVTEKAKFVKDHGLAGLFYWQIAGDRCGSESLVKAGFEALQ